MTNIFIQTFSMPWMQVSSDENVIRRHGNVLKKYNNKFLNAFRNRTMKYH